jgi:Lon protease-like protein
VLPVIGAGILARVDPLPDGRSNIVVRGVLRARIVEEIITQEPYRLVRAEPLRDLPIAPSREAALADELRQLVLAYSARRPGAPSSALLQIAGSRASPGELADAVGAAVLESPHERQQLLEVLSPEERLGRVSQRLAVVLAQTEGGRGTLPN